MEENHLQELKFLIKKQMDENYETHKTIHQLPICISKYKPAIEELIAHQKHLIKKIDEQIKDCSK
ncbi:MAG: hypothetical protein JKY89_03670 [Immundisolibacteraceae bacterium]|nr:hypothetical protein [Immundisolibacteraceae bacterium]